MCLIGIHGTAWRSTGMLFEPSKEKFTVVFGQPIHLNEYRQNTNYTAVQTLINQLIDNSDISKQKVQSICIASPGIRSSHDVLRMREILDAGGWTGLSHVLTDDAPAVLVSGGLTDEGIVVTVGSNSSVFGRVQDGTVWRVGGWGTVIGDIASGYELARLALNAISKAEDGRGPECNALKRCILEHLKIDSMDMLTGWSGIYHRMGAQSNISHLAPIVTVAAEEYKDQVAQDILESAAKQLGDAVQIVAQRLGIEISERKVLIEGGVIENSAFLRSRFKEHLQSIHPKADVSYVRYRAVVGAVLFAASREQNLPDKAVISALTAVIDKRLNDPDVTEFLAGPNVRP